MLPTHCYSCKVVLMGGATKHKPDCEVRQLIEEVMGRASQPPERSKPHEKPSQR